MKVAYIYLLFLLIGSTSIAQNYSFRHLQVEDGLSHNSVICMLQDSKGFMWFGTKDGLNRYDGYSFKTFQHIQTDYKSIGSNFIRCLYEFNNYIWVGTDTGLFRYEELTESFQLIEATRSLPVLDVKSSASGNLWFIAGGNLYKLNTRDKGAKPEIFDRLTVNYISLDKQSNVYVASSNALYKYIPENNSFQKLDIDFGAISKLVTITAISCNGDGQLLIGTKDHGAFIYNIRLNIIHPILPNSENPLFVRDFLVKDKNEIWIASESGVYIYNIKKNTYTRCRKNYGDPYSLTDNAVYSLVLDKEGSVWIGTYFGGINYYPKPYTPIERYFPKVGENSISGNAVREIKKDKDGNLWIGTEDAGLNKFNLTTGKFESFTSSVNGGKLSHYNIHGLLSIGNELWVGTFEHGLDVIDINTGAIIRHYSKGKSGLRSDFIFYIYKTKSSDIYVLTSSGIHKYITETDSFKVVEGFPEIYHYTYIKEDHSGTLWAGTYWDGLYFYNPETKAKGFFRYQNNDPASISCNVINGIFEDSSKRLWITTENGLNLYNAKSKKFKRYTKADGFPSNITYAILEDRHKKLWITSSNGLIKFDPLSSAIKVFTKSSGLLSDQFNYCSAFKDSNGEMYFGSVKGMISFNSDNFVESSFHPPLYITDIFINNEDVPVGKQNSPLQKSIIFSDKIVLNNDQSSFRLEFASLGYTSTEMTQYWYTIDGLNDKWIPLGKNHEVNFTQLSPGDYTFKVKSLNSYGKWNKKYGRLSITVLPPFYAGKIAYSLYLILALLTGYLLLRYYHRYTKNENNLRISALENEKEKEIYQAKIEFFTNIAHEIRTPLTLIKSPLEKLLKQKYQSLEIPRNLNIMERNTSRLLNLINELLDFRKAEMKHIKLSFVMVNIAEMLDDTFLRFSQLILEKELDFEILKESEEVLAFVDEEAFGKVLSNLFSNAIKYSKKTVQVQLNCNNQYFEVIFKNDGELIPQNLRKKIFEPFFRLPTDAQSSGTGIGLSLAHSLVELHNGNLYIDDKDTKMNSFILNLPVHQKEEFTNIKSTLINRHSQNESSIRTFDKQAPLILVAEDNKELADFIFSELSGSYNVVLAKNGEEAIQLITKHEIQLVVSDIMMPVKNGIELCKHIKHKETTSHIPVILLTAKSALSAKIEGLESGADAYITKPFSMDYLLIQISNLIENRKNVLGHFSSSPLAHLKSLATSVTDKTFLSKLDKAIEDNLKDQDLSVDKLADILNMSRSTLYRSVKDISQLSPNELINLSRLKKAAQLIKTTDMKIYEVAETVGYKSQTSFGRNFQKHFGMTPKEFDRSKEINDNAARS